MWCSEGVIVDANHGTTVLAVCVCVCVFSKSCHLVYDQVFQKTGFELVIWNSNEIFQVSLCVALVMFYLCLDDAVYT